MIYLSLVSTIWALSFGLVGNTLSGIDPFFVSLLRLVFACLIFIPFLKIKCLSFKYFNSLFYFGFIQFGIMYVSYIKAFQYLPSYLVAIFSILTPIYVVLIHDIKNKKFSKKYIVAAFTSVIGAMIIRVQEIPIGDFWFGFGLMQIAGISFAYGQISYRDWKLKHETINTKDIFFIMLLGGTICAGLFSLIFTDKESISINPTQWYSILYLGMIASGLGFYLWNKGATLCNAGTLAVFNNAVVPLAVFCSLFIFGEINSISSEDLIRLILGGLLIALAIKIAQGDKKD